MTSDTTPLSLLIKRKSNKSCEVKFLIAVCKNLSHSPKTEHLPIYFLPSKKKLQTLLPPPHPVQKKLQTSLQQNC